MCINIFLLADLKYRDFVLLHSICTLGCNFILCIYKVCHLVSKFSGIGKKSFTTGGGMLLSCLFKVFLVGML